MNSLCCLLVLSGSSPAWCINVPMGGAASVQRFTGIWREEPEKSDKTHPKLSYSPIVLDMARIIGRLRGAPGYATGEDPLAEEKDILHSKSGTLQLPPVLNQEPGLARVPEAETVNVEAQSLSVEAPLISSSASISAAANSLAHLVAPALSARVQPRLPKSFANPDLDNNFLLWTVGTISGGNEWNQPVTSDYHGSFVVCAPGVKIKSMSAQRINLLTGRLLICNRGAEIMVITPHADVVIPTGAAAILDAGESSTLRVTALDCPAGKSISIINKDQPSPLASGFEYSLNAQGQATKSRVQVVQLLTSDPLLRGEKSLDGIRRAALSSLTIRLADNRQVHK